MNIVTLPPDYSAEDRDQREAILKEVAALQRRYHEEAEPLIAALAAIEARYALRSMIVPDFPAADLRRAAAVMGGGPDRA